MHGAPNSTTDRRTGESVSTHAHVAEHGNKSIAILIALIAALLAITETGGKSAQTAMLSHHIEAANSWAFFQAKTIRMTTIRTAAEALQLEAADGVSPELAAARAKQNAAWRATAERYESEPSTGEGRKELAARAKAEEEQRARALGAYHQFEIASAAFQLAIVLASASIITGVIWLVWLAGGLSCAGLGLALLGWLAPTLVHL
ncbi:MAG: DUF4337 domain-containing protein [Proteobacteria bacterium]|nr:DUF4337 domain-containing protein [Pseudomonadota bacterium]